MLKSFNNLSIQYKLLFYFLILIVLPILTISYLTDIVFSNAMENAAIESSVQAINQADNSIETQIKNIDNVMNIIARNSEVLEFLRMKNTTDSDAETMLEPGIRSFLAGFTQYYQGVEGIALISQHDLFLSNEMYRIEQDPLIDGKWFQDCIRDSDQLYILGRPVGRKLTEYKNISADELVTLVKAVKDPVNDEISGVILIDLHINVLEKVLKNIKLGKIGFIYILDSNGEVIYSPINYIVPRVKNQWFTKKRAGIFNKYILKQHFQFIYSTSTYTKWKIIGVFSLNEALKEVVNIRHYILLILLAIIIIAVAISVVFSSSIANPINKLRKLMKKAESGDLSVNFEVRYSDEIGQLGRSFNKMISEIRNLIDVVYKEQKSKREAELRTLQSQIKPHFLYNTLDTIHWMAKKYGANDVIQVINALTNLFRIGLSKGNEIIRVVEEVEHVNSYLVIQKVRYEEMLEYEIEVADEIKSLYVQKLILQPIVENAIYHGIKAKKEPGKIMIRAEIQGEVLIFRVSDNGIGISEPELAKINNALLNENSEKVGYGLFNVNERIRLSYGKEYGVSVQSVMGIGTTVEIKHPVISILK